MSVTTGLPHVVPHEEGRERADAFVTFGGVPSLTGSVLASGSIGRVWRPWAASSTSRSQRQLATSTNEDFRG